MKIKCIQRWVLTGEFGLSVAGAGLMLAACDGESSSSKTTSSKTVETPEGKKKVTETTETKTTTDKKSNP